MATAVEFTVSMKITLSLLSTSLLLYDIEPSSLLHSDSGHFEIGMVVTGHSLIRSLVRSLVRSLTCS